jgi:hypothetical protein
MWLFSTLWLASFLLSSIACCTKYRAPATAPNATDIRIVGKIIDGGPPQFEKNENVKLSFFIVTPQFVSYEYWLMWQVREQALTIEKLRAIIEKK